MCCSAHRSDTYWRDKLLFQFNSEASNGDGEQHARHAIFLAAHMTLPHWIGPPLFYGKRRLDLPPNVGPVTGGRSSRLTLFLLLESPGAHVLCEAISLASVRFSCDLERVT